MLKVIVNTFNGNFCSFDTVSLPGDRQAAKLTVQLIQGDSGEGDSQRVTSVFPKLSTLVFSLLCKLPVLLSHFFPPPLLCPSSELITNEHDSRERKWAHQLAALTCRYDG